MISLTALVLTYNEQENIRRNLEALVWVPKVIVVDSFSNDQTLEIARSFPNVQVVQRVFDTHANQKDNQAKLLGQLGDAVDAFMQDLANMKQQDNVTIMTFSEFGRRPHENGSKGTDHGAAAPMLLVGGKVQAGVVGRHPSLTDHTMGNLKHHTDFRQVYAVVVDKWLGVSSKEILGGIFEPVKILRS